MTTARNAAVGARTGVTLQQYLSNVLMTMTVGLAITGGVGWYIAHDNALMQMLFHLHPGVDSHGHPAQVMEASGWWWGSVALMLGLTLFIPRSQASMPGSLSFTLFGVFAAATAVMITPSLYAYTDVSIVKVALITAATFGGAALWGKTTKIDLRPMGTFFLMALIGLLIVLVMNIFVSTPLIDNIVSGAAVVLFAGLTAFDIQRLEDYHDEYAPGGGPVAYGALVLYLDALNLFLHLLRLFGTRK